MPLASPVDACCRRFHPNRSRTALAAVRHSTGSNGWPRISDVFPIKAAGTAASFRGVYARARVTFKAARFRARKGSLVQLRAAEAVPLRGSL
jgi:hypothetical protein